MFHDRRVFGVQDVGTPEELAEKLTEHTWTLCTGFRIAGYLFLNDSISEDGAAEFALVREADGMQLNSITFGWMDQDRALACIRKAIAGGYENNLGMVRVRLKVAANHGCWLCR